MKTDPSKFEGELHVTGRVGKLSVKVVYERVMVKSWIMSATTGRVHWTMYQLGWSVVTQTDLANHLGLNAALNNLL